MPPWISIPPKVNPTSLWGPRRPFTVSSLNSSVILLSLFFSSSHTSSCHFSNTSSIQCIGRTALSVRTSSQSWQPILSLLTVWTQTLPYYHVTNTNLPSPLTFGLPSLPYSLLGPLATLSHAGFLLVSFSHHLSLQTEYKLNMCWETIFQFKYILLNILEQVPIFAEYFHVTDNYNKDIKANLNGQIIILYCGTIKSKIMLLCFLYYGYQLDLN